MLVIAPVSLQNIHQYRPSHDKTISFFYLKEMFSHKKCVLNVFPIPSCFRNKIIVITLRKKICYWNVWSTKQLKTIIELVYIWLFVFFDKLHQPKITAFIIHLFSQHSMIYKYNSVKMKYYCRFVMDKKNLSYERTLHWNRIKTIYQLKRIKSAIWLQRFINIIGHLKIWMHTSTMFNQQMARSNKLS